MCWLAGVSYVRVCLCMAFTFRAPKTLASRYFLRFSFPFRDSWSLNTCVCMCGCVLTWRRQPNANRKLAWKKKFVREIKATSRHTKHKREEREKKRCARRITHNINSLVQWLSPCVFYSLCVGRWTQRVNGGWRREGESSVYWYCKVQRK